MENLSPTGSIEPLPPWLASRIRRAAVFTCLGWSVPFSAAAILFLAIALSLAYGVFDSTFPPVFWLAVFLGGMVFLGRELAAGLPICLRPERSPEIAYLRRYGPLASVASRIHVVFRSTRAPEAQAKCLPAEAARLLDHLAGCRPGILLGHTAEAERLWETDPAAFLAAVPDDNHPDS